MPNQIENYLKNSLASHTENYSKKYETSEVWLLYPINEDMRDHPAIEFYSGDNTYVRLFFVDVANIENSLKELKQRIVI